MKSRENGRGNSRHGNVREDFGLQKIPVMGLDLLQHSYPWVNEELCINPPDAQTQRRVVVSFCNSKLPAGDPSAVLEN